MCADPWYEGYKNAPNNGKVCKKGWAQGYAEAPTNTVGEKDFLRVLRGGSWFVQPAHCRSAARSKFVFHQGGNNIGLRPVISIGLKGVWLNMLYKIF